MLILNSDQMKFAVMKLLVSNFENVFVYKEAMSASKFPQFYINLLDVSEIQDRKNKFILDYQFNVRYRFVSDTQTELKLQDKLDDVADKLMYLFDIIELEENEFAKVINKSLTKTDGVLHFNFVIRTMGEKPLPENVKQLKLDYTMEVGNGKIHRSCESR